MPTAKSYADLPIIGEPYIVNKRSYVNVKTKSGKEKAVRWYTDAEYAKMYAQTSASEQHTSGIHRTYKEVLGFDKGYITLFKGNTYAHMDWFHVAPTRYSNVWGWYLVSTDEIPEDMPEDLTPVKLYWKDISKSDEEIIPIPEISAWVENLLFANGASSYVGSIGERIDVTVVIRLAQPLEGQWGHSTFHIMSDTHGNIYTWTTASKSLVLGETYHIKGTIKEHKNYKGEQQTVLTRCTVCDNKI